MGRKRRVGEGEGRQRLTCDRFVSEEIKKRYDLDIPEYEGVEQVVEIGNDGSRL